MTKKLDQESHKAFLPTDADVARFIAAFRRNSVEAKKNGTITKVLIYRKDCHFCHDQFRAIAKMGFRVKDGQLVGSAANMSRIADRIYIVERNSKEALNFEKKTKKLEAVPAWFDFDPSKKPPIIFLQYGAVGPEGIKSLTRG